MIRNRPCPIAYNRLPFSTKPDMLTIRPATAADTGILLDLIRGLAEYEHLSHLVTASEATLKDALFGAQPGAEALLAFEGEHAVGFAVYFHNFSTFLGRR